MRMFRGLLPALALVGFATLSVLADEAPVTLQSLLEQMPDRDRLARLEEPPFRLLQASSHDRHKTDPADAKNWHSNHDYDQFIRTETNDGRQEWVIMEHVGPGAIVRMWLPLESHHDEQVIRFYLDGSPTPTISAKFNDLMSGRDFVKPPLAFVSWNETDLSKQVGPTGKSRRGVAGDLYLPIPFARCCKITLDSLPFYYIINYRSYQPGTTVKSFTMADYESAGAALDKTAQELVNHAQKSAALVKTRELAPREFFGVDLPAGPAAVRNLCVHLESSDPQALRSTVLQASFDDEADIWCPLSEFFGAGVRGKPVQDFFRSVDSEGNLTARWVMPYEHSGRIALKNVGSKPITLSLSAEAEPWTWNDRSLHFHADWHCDMGLKTRPMADWNYIHITGKGHYVGDTLTVYTPSPKWYGEGDERVYIDGENTPSHIGTGTEDYYGYAWGMADFFSSPFISEPSRDRAGDRDDWSGYTTTSRVRLLDEIPFGVSLKHDMEIWNWAETEVDYAVGTFWYARPGASCNRQPQPEQAGEAIHEVPPTTRPSTEPRP